MNPSPLVSVCLITYNHSEYICEAIDSILMQQVNFSWEIIIADDFSSDGTREIVLDYERKYPELIKLLFQKKNVGGGRNFVDLINSASGKYVAYIEGDDYWTDPLKLQKQFDFLENHSEFSMCYHRIKWVYTYDVPDFDPKKESNEGDGLVSTIEDILERGWFIRSCSIFYRNFSLPANFEDLYIGDYPLHILLAYQGKVGFIPKVMGVYRINNRGASETTLVTNSTDDLKIRLIQDIQMWNYINRSTNYDFERFCQKKIAWYIASYFKLILKYSPSRIIVDLSKLHKKLRDYHSLHNTFMISKYLSNLLFKKIFYRNSNIDQISKS